MASRRGLSNQERLAVDIKNVTATGAIVAAPCYLYWVTCSIDDSTTSGLFSIGNTSAAADLIKESTRIDLKFGTAGASGNCNEQRQLIFSPPVYIETQLFYTLSTGIDAVSVGYLAKG